MASAITTQQPNRQVTPQKDVRALIMSDAFQEQIKKALPAALSADVLLRVATTTIQKTPKLLECSRESLMQCVLECAQMGLLPDGILGQAYMVPYKTTATLQIGYRGILELARRSGHIKYVVAEPVYDCDEFSITFAPIRSIKHVPAIDNELRGEKLSGKYLPAGFRGAYALVLYKDDTIDFEYLPLHKIERIRNLSQAGNKADAPWLEHFEEMARKTAIRALGKRLPLSADDQRRIIDDENRDYGLGDTFNGTGSLPGKVRQIDALPSAATELMDKLDWSLTKRQLAISNNPGEKLLPYLRDCCQKAGIAVAQPEQEPAERTVELDENEAVTREEESMRRSAATDNVSDVSQNRNDDSRYDGPGDTAAAVPANHSYNDF